MSLAVNPFVTELGVVLCTLQGHVLVRLHELIEKGGVPFIILVHAKVGTLTLWLANPLVQRPVLCMRTNLRQTPQHALDLLLKTLELTCF